MQTMTIGHLKSHFSPFSILADFKVSDEELLSL